MINDKLFIFFFTFQAILFMLFSGLIFQRPSSAKKSFMQWFETAKKTDAM